MLLLLLVASGSVTVALVAASVVCALVVERRLILLLMLPVEALELGLLVLSESIMVDTTSVSSSTSCCSMCIDDPRGEADGVMGGEV